MFRLQNSSPSYLICLKVVSERASAMASGEPKAKRAKLQEKEKEKETEKESQPEEKKLRLVIADLFEYSRNRGVGLCSSLITL